MQAGMLRRSGMPDSATPRAAAPRLLCPRESPGKDTGAGCHFLLQGIFPALGLNLSLWHLLRCQVDSLLLDHLGRPRRGGNEVFFIMIIKSSTQQQPKYPCAYNFTLIKQKRNLKLSKQKKNVFTCNESDHNRICMIYIPLKESHSNYVSSGCFTCEILCLPENAFPALLFSWETLCKLLYRFLLVQLSNYHIFWPETLRLSTLPEASDSRRSTADPDPKEKQVKRAT